MTLLNNILSVHFKLPYSFKWIQIVDNEGKEIISKSFTADKCECHLSICMPGKYYFFLYVSNNGISYDCFIGGKQIELEKDDASQWNFVLPVYTIWNRNLIKSGELDYVLCNTILDNRHTMAKAASKLTSECCSIRDKVLIIHDFVANNLFYDYDSLQSTESTNRTIEQIVSERKCVCQGYADLTLVLLKSLGIEAENILCYVVNNIYERGWSDVKNRTSELNHIITRVKLENRWLYMDVTWDSNNRYENGKYIKGDDVSHRYFDVTLPFLSSTHRFFKKRFPDAIG